MNITMDAAAFQKLVLNEFPVLREDFEEWDNLVHLQIMEFLGFTQAAIEAGSYDVVSKCFEIANTALSQGNDGLRNAICVSYLAHLDLRSDAGNEAAHLMPAELERARNDVFDYVEQLIGRKRPEDNR
jgi:hypothetical protein